jgi:signal peptidase I
LGFVSPGVGYLYAGRGRHGLLLLLLFPGVSLGIWLLAVLAPVPILCVVLPFVLILALRVVLARGAARSARAFPAERPVPRFSRWYSCLAAFVLGVGLNHLWAHACRTTLVHPFRMQAGSMEPTFLIGDRLLVDKWSYGWRDPVFGRVVSDSTPPARGDLVVFLYPDNSSRIFIKRCIGLPGETVEVRGPVVLVDDRPLDEPYAQSLRAGSGGLGEAGSLEVWGPQVVPEDSYFVLGDNRDNSRDSRYFGFVPRANLLGRARVIYWSYEAARDEYPMTLDREAKDTLAALTRTRWDRIGKVLE